MKMKFTKLLKEIALQELGETTDTYNVRLVGKRMKSSENIAITLGFDTPEHSYEVNIFENYEGLLTVNFATDQTGDRATNEGNPFKVTATVLKAAEKAWDLVKEEGLERIKGFAFTPIGKSEIDQATRREKLYRTFIEKQFPTADIVKTKHGTYEVYLD